MRCVCLGTGQSSPLTELTEWHLVIEVGLKTEKPFGHPLEERYLKLEERACDGQVEGGMRAVVGRWRVRVVC